MEIQDNLSQWTLRTVIELSSTERDVTDAVRRFDSFIENLQVDSNTTFNLQVAFHEALSNAVQHGNKADPSKCVVAECVANDRMMRICVADEGEGFNPKAVAEMATDPYRERGRGLFLISNLMDEVSYNEKGNAISMVKFRLQPASEQQDGNDHCKVL